MPTDETIYSFLHKLFRLIKIGRVTYMEYYGDNFIDKTTGEILLSSDEIKEIAEEDINYHMILSELIYEAKYPGII